MQNNHTQTRSIPTLSLVDWLYGFSFPFPQCRNRSFFSKCTIEGSQRARINLAMVKTVAIKLRAPSRCNSTIRKLPLDIVWCLLRRAVSGFRRRGHDICGPSMCPCFQRFTVVIVLMYGLQGLGDQISMRLMICGKRKARVSSSSRKESLGGAAAMSSFSSSTRTL